MGRSVAEMFALSMASQRRTSVVIWLIATRADCVARKKRSLFSITWDEDWKAAAIAVRSIEVIAREIMISTRLRPRRTYFVMGRFIIVPPDRCRAGGQSGFR